MIIGQGAGQLSEGSVEERSCSAGLPHAQTQHDRGAGAAPAEEAQRCET